MVFIQITQHIYSFWDRGHSHGNSNSRKVYVEKNKEDSEMKPKVVWLSYAMSYITTTDGSTILRSWKSETRVLSAEGWGISQQGGIVGGHSESAAVSVNAG